MAIITTVLFTVSPNPTKGTIFISSGAKKFSNIEAYTVSGELVTAKVVLNDNKAQIDLTGKPKGIYVLQIYMGKECGFYKVMLE